MSEPRRPEPPDERDAWLHQALRHAPDLATAPPHALREAILAEARSAVQARARRAAEPSLLAHAAAFWSWLARPPVAAGFASVMAATLVGLMWWDRPMDETLRPASMSSSRGVESSPALPASQPAPTEASTPVLSPPAALPQTAAAPSPADAATSRRAIAAPAKTAPAAIDAEKTRKDEPAALSPQSVSPASPFPGNGVSESSALAGSLRDERRQTTPSVARKQESEAASGAQVSGNVAALAKPASPARERAAIARRDTAGAAGPTGAADALSAGAAATPQAFAAAPPAAQAPAPAPERESLKSAAKASPRPMAPLMASLAQDAPRWSRHGASGSQPLAASTQAWLADVDAAAAGRWQATDGNAARAELPAQASASAVLLDRDGRAATLVRVEDAGVFFRQETGAAWFAPLPADTIARLRATLPN
jgi:hypothetical protein